MMTGNPGSLEGLLMSARPALLAALLFAMLASVVAGCGGEEETTASSPTATATATQEADSPLCDGKIRIRYTVS
jgi:hypothetical protein